MGSSENSVKNPLSKTRRIYGWPVRAVLIRVAKIPESRNLHRKTNITWHQTIFEIGPNEPKLIYGIQNGIFLGIAGSYLESYRSSGPKVFCKKGVLRDFAKFTGKHLLL